MFNPRTGGALRFLCAPPARGAMRPIVPDVPRLATIVSPLPRRVEESFANQLTSIAKSKKERGQAPFLT